jgi:hypothetical protein
LRLFWIEIYGLNNEEHHLNVECLKLLKAIKVVEKVLKTFLKRIIKRATLARKMATMGQLFY